MWKVKPTPDGTTWEAGRHKRRARCQEDAKRDAKRDAAYTLF